MAKTLTIASVDYLPFYKTDSAKIKETLRKTNVMNLEFVTQDTADAPQEGAELIFKDGSRFLFAGFITRVQPKEVGIGQQFTYAVEVSDYASIFTHKIARRAYANKTMNYIINDLMSEYVDSSYGFDLTNVQTGPTLTSISFDHITIQKCFEKITKVTGYVWWVDYEKKLYFQTSTTDTAPETVTDASANVDSVNITYDTSQVRNSVIVIGSTNGVESLDLVEEHFDGDGETRAWELDNKPSTISYIKLNGVSKQYSLDLNERDTDYFVYSFTGSSFRLIDASPTPSGSDDIDIAYYPRIAIIQQQTDPASVAFFQALDGGDGIYEYTVKDASIGTLDEATERAMQELSEYSMPLVEGVITTRSGLLASPTNVFKPGQILTVNLPSQGLSSDTAFLIQEVIIQVLDASSEYEYTIKFGGKIVSIQQFLESLASQQFDGNTSENPDEIITIEAVVDRMEFSDTDTPISKVNQTPPFQYGAGGSPQGVWNLSEWA